jgi:predicted NAD/FAD-binding protein
MKVAIVGGGISGLVAAWRLRDVHDVTLFEANNYLGGHTNTVSVDDRDADDRPLSIDTGFIVFNDWTYPNFIALLDELGVASQPTEMSFSVRDDAAKLEYNGHSLATLFAQRTNIARPRFLRMLADIVRFNRQAPRLLENVSDDRTVGEFLERHRYSRVFRDWYLLPMGSAIWSCPQIAFEQFPIRFIVEFYRHHGLLNLRQRPTWRVVRGGSQTYIRAMAAQLGDRIRLSSPVTGVRRFPDRVEVTSVARGSSHAGAPRTESFDWLILACHSDQSLRILGNEATATERAVLGEFPYGRSVAVLHTDESLLPRRRRAWASWNYRLTGDSAAPATVTYNMNILQRLKARHTYCVTLNDRERIDEKRILGEFVYLHPLFNTRRPVPAWRIAHRQSDQLLRRLLGQRLSRRRRAKRARRREGDRSDRYEESSRSWGYLPFSYILSYARCSLLMPLRRNGSPPSPRTEKTRVSQPPLHAVRRSRRTAGAAEQTLVLVRRSTERCLVPPRRLPRSFRPASAGKRSRSGRIANRRAPERTDPVAYELSLFRLGHEPDQPLLLL